MKPKFTNLFYVALFFAVDRYNPDKLGKTCAVWIINNVQQELGDFINFSEDRDYYDERFNNNFNESYRNFYNLDTATTNPIENGINLLIPRTISKRMQAQSGVFFYGINFNNSFEGNLFDCDKDAVEEIKKSSASIVVNNHSNEFITYLSQIITQSRVTKIILHKKIYPFVWNELNCMNITEATLFPDLQGLITFLYHKE